MISSISYPKRSDMNDEYVMNSAETILDVAERQLAKQGIVDMSLGTVAAEVGCSKATIYRHYANKDELMLAVFNRELLWRLNMSQKILDAECFNALERLVLFSTSNVVYRTEHPYAHGLAFLATNSVLWRRASKDSKQGLVTNIERVRRIPSLIIEQEPSVAAQTEQVKAVLDAMFALERGYIAANCNFVYGAIYNCLPNRHYIDRFAAIARQLMWPELTQVDGDGLQVWLASELESSAIR
ncbi:TetR/AcrR family transcriptional regulator [Ferrimonas lipolytica]|uniref:TetR/AcrR family transcriptional regulator n=1 Tax=Ferrimonas lipolytica TaxID=2724191 RepID=A0A6H1UFD4_9GAMM|nr:TetR/AcrR family transcriptional regulator [Ferrimonas lipolytica]QIZ77043.1 TetR/AcrR family transcriptional regulator [Ferrimonas lipolytica]